MSQPRRIRRAARILLHDRAGRLLLFRFTPDDRAPFWCAPGGEVEEGETYPKAARRELAEETGIDTDPGEEVAQVISDFLTLDGEPVTGDDRYFLVRVDHPTIDTSGHTASEQAVMREYRWFLPEEIAPWPETIYPLDMPEMLARVAAAQGA
jgi:8-oxo-dGTP diphosphatase